MDPVVATARGVHPEDDPLAVPILDHPADELEGPVRLVVLPAERAVVLAVRPGRQQFAVIAAIDDLVDMAQDDVPGGNPVVAQDADLLEGTGAVLAVGQDRDARAPVGLGRGLEHAPVARRQPALGSRDLDDAGTERGPAHDRPGVVVGIDAFGHVGGEQVGELLDRDPMAPMRRAVVAIVVQPGRRDDLDAGPLRDVRELRGVAARVARHGIDHGAQPETGRLGHLGGHRLHVPEIELRLELDRPSPIDHQVLVGVGHAELLGRDVAEHGPDEGHRGDRLGSVGELQDRAVGAQSIAQRARVDVARIAPGWPPTWPPRSRPPGPSPCIGPSSAPMRARRASR